MGKHVNTNNCHLLLIMEECHHMLTTFLRKLLFGNCKFHHRSERCLFLEFNFMLPLSLQEWYVVHSIGNALLFIIKLRFLWLQNLTTTDWRQLPHAFRAVTIHLELYMRQLCPAFLRMTSRLLPEVACTAILLPWNPKQKRRLTMLHQVPSC